MINNILTTFDKSNNVIDYKLDSEEFLNINIYEDIWNVNNISNIFKYITINKYLKILGNDTNFGIKWANDIYSKRYGVESLLVAYDVFGGLFVIKDYQLGGNQLWYFAPDTMVWENLKITYQNFIKWICTDDFLLFYSNFPVEYMSQNFVQIEKEAVLHIYPYLWSQEYKTVNPSINVISFRELFELNQDIYRQLSF
ncbi:DUF2625 family protein [Carnobacteriaceae bacterium zg-ZUI240]|nr:DUF2625 family protein [Carnobacteriaceae bacterium zg-ZUI240]